jgi:hypothetical protein
MAIVTQPIVLHEQMRAAKTRHICSERSAWHVTSSSAPSRGVAAAVGARAGGGAAEAAAQAARRAAAGAARSCRTAPQLRSIAAPATTTRTAAACVAVRRAAQQRRRRATEQRRARQTALFAAPASRLCRLLRPAPWRSRCSPARRPGRPRARGFQVLSPMPRQADVTGTCRGGVGTFRLRVPLGPRKRVGRSCGATSKGCCRPRGSGCALSAGANSAAAHFSRY